MNGNSMREKVIKKIEELEWSVTEGDDGSLELEKYSPAGEDFGFEVKGKDVAAEVREYADDFDTDEHIEMWVMARHNVSGVPDIKTLVQDADDIQKMLDGLADALDALEYKLFEEAVQAIVDGEYSRYCKKNRSAYIYEMYADYRDEMQSDTAVAILEANDPDQSFNEKLNEWYMDQEDELRDDLEEKIKGILSKEDGLFPNGLTDEQEDDLRNMLFDMVWFTAPADHYLKQEFYVNIMVDTGDGNYDYTLNSVYPCYCGDYDEPIDEKASIVWLAKQQGYSKKQLESALKSDGNDAPEGFLRSMRKELANMPSHMATLTFLVKMTLENLLKLNELMKLQDRDGHHYDACENPDCGCIVIAKNTETGLYDPWGGGGSVLEIELEKDVELPVKFIRSALPDGGDGYSISNVYGLCGSVWRDTIKEIRKPKEEKNEA